MMKLLIGLRELIRFSYPFYISNRFNLWEVIMEDGLYWVTTSYLCAGFVVKNGKVSMSDCAPILRNKIEYWKTIAKKVVNEKE